MQETILGIAARDWIGDCPPPAGLSGAPGGDQHVSDGESEFTDEWKQLWIDLGGEA